MADERATVPPTPGASADASTPRPRWMRPALVGAEGAVAILTALFFLGLSTFVKVDPMDRIGQVSGLAALLLRFFLIGLLLVALLIAAYRFAGPLLREWATRLSCAAVAGLSTGLVAGGARVALSDTPWPFNADQGDAGHLANWAAGQPDDNGLYPPVVPKVLELISDAFHDGNTSYGFKTMELLFMAFTGPLAYLAWRMLLRPIWALGIGVLATVPVWDPYKPYSALVLLLFFPVMIQGIRMLRRAPETPWRPLLGWAVGLGVAIGLLFDTYSGWFVWSAAGILGAVLFVFPWRRGPKKALAYLGAMVVVTVAVCGSYLIDLLTGSKTAVDDYFYFDAYTDPGYFEMWRHDLPGVVSEWPMREELGGVGLFAVLIFVGLAVALALGMRRSFVIVVALSIASTFLMRFWFASHMYQDQAVQLWPRTNIELVYGFLLITGFAVKLVVDRVRAGGRVGALLPERVKGAAGMPIFIGAFCALLLFFASVGSATANRYMPQAPPSMDSYKDRGLGTLSWFAHMTAKPDGTCPKWAVDKQCLPGDHPWLAKKNK
ncbi:hypothetical protein GT354_25630 [Streptomyces sp. SID3343]|nr:hypothetical protein [Streptomyces sp. SID3343]